MMQIKQVLKLIVFGLYCLTFAIVALLIAIIPKDRYQQRLWLAPWMSYMSKATLRLLGVNVDLEQHENTALKPNYFIVANHLSYLDILIVSAYFPCCFVTSYEVREMPGLGALSELGGCLYVERRSKTNLHQEIYDIEEALERGLNVCIFPEATSTNGEQLLRFRRPLYLAAISTHTPILPLCINYASINDEPVSAINRDALFWYGSMDFLPHFWQLLKFNKIEIQLTACEFIDDVRDCPKEASERSYALINEHFRPVQSYSDNSVALFFPPL